MAHTNQIPEGFSLKDGKIFVASSREAIVTYLEKSKIEIPGDLRDTPRYTTKQGCFVTLKLNDAEKSLRGCIGFPEPIYPLSRALTEASVYAATADPRFEPVSSKELNELLVDVSTLTNPRLIETKSLKELPGRIDVGTDGLIMRWSFGSGILLPQVASEQNWDAEEFLSNLSMKAGAPPDQWLVPGTMVLKFQCQIFSETVPGGSVIMT